MVPSQTEELWSAIQENGLSAAWKILGREASSDLDLNGLNKDGSSLLHLAASQGDVALCMLLFSKGASSSTRNAQGRTPLHCAAAKGNYQMITFFLKTGASATIEDADGCTPRKLAAEAGFTSAADLLAIAEANPEEGRRLAVAAASRSKSMPTSASNASLPAGAPSPTPQSLSRSVSVSATQKKIEKLESKVAQLEEEVKRLKTVEVLSRADARLLAKQEGKLASLSAELEVLRGNDKGGRESLRGNPNAHLRPIKQKRSWREIFGF